MSYLFNTFLYQPIINVLVFLYNTVAFGDLGVAIIMLTVLVRLCLAPMYHKMLHQQAITKKMRPEMQKIQEEYKNDKEKQTALLMELYKKYKINPFYTFLVLLIQLPILWALFKAFSKGLSGGVSSVVYPFITDPGTFNNIAFGFLDLNGRSLILIALTAIAQFVQTKISSPVPETKGKPGSFAASGNVMGIMLSLFSVFILWRLPAAVAVYWLTTTLFSIGQQFICNKSVRNAELKGNNN
jgi:YidC/Oxa1 family membrane protein insertase